jgi:hypothetical protein
MAVVISALKPVARSPSSVCNGDHLDPLTEHAIDDEEWKPTQQKTSSVGDVKEARLQVAL